LGTHRGIDRPEHEVARAQQGHHRGATREVHAPLSSPRPVGKQAPPALMRAPGAIGAPSSTGSLDAVVVQTRSAPSTATRAEGTASAASPSLSPLRRR
jgi:hypothetical protein